jgi:hypothetical protein
MGQTVTVPKDGRLQTGLFAAAQVRCLQHLNLREISRCGKPNPENHPVLPLPAWCPVIIRADHPPRFRVRAKSKLCTGSVYRRFTVAPSIILSLLKGEGLLRHPSTPRQARGRLSSGWRKRENSPSTVYTLPSLNRIPNRCAYYPLVDYQNATQNSSKENSDLTLGCWHGSKLCLEDTPR